MDSANIEFNKHARLFEDHENKESKVIHPMILESTTPLKIKEEMNSSTPYGDVSETRSKFYESASARMRTLSAITAAKTYEPTNPFFRVVLRPSYLYRGCIMHLPSGFAEKYLSGISSFIKIQLGERQWPVRCLYKAGRAKFSQGWYEFTHENNIGEGDVCVFELLSTRDFILKVTAFMSVLVYEVEKFHVVSFNHLLSLLHLLENQSGSLF
ncbi:hypothetical protein N665_0720s0007 [Sinapis alba]|nr:hypothetical protein N665_0720s0007 [Sinapis alba]